MDGIDNLFPDNLFEAFDIESMDGFTFNPDEDAIATRYTSPVIHKPQVVAYRHAAEMVKCIKAAKDESIYAIIDGTFIFGELLEALIYDRGLLIDEMYIATLSVSEENVDSLKNIMLSGRCKKMDLILSHYFYSHERTSLIPYIYQELDSPDNNFQLSIARNHCKIALFKSGNLFYTIHGSANLRSSNNIEQIMINESESLYQFNRDFMDTIIAEYKTIRHEHNPSVRGETLWQAVQQASTGKGAN